MPRAKDGAAMNLGEFVGGVILAAFIVFLVWIVAGALGQANDCRHKGGVWMAREMVCLKKEMTIP